MIRTKCLKDCSVQNALFTSICQNQCVKFDSICADVDHSNILALFHTIRGPGNLFSTTKVNGHPITVSSTSWCAALSRCWCSTSGRRMSSPRRTSTPTSSSRPCWSRRWQLSTTHSIRSIHPSCSRIRPGATNLIQSCRSVYLRVSPNLNYQGIQGQQ